VLEPTAAVAGLAGVVAAAAVAVWADRPAVVLFAASVIVLAGLVDAPRRVQVGPVSGLAVLTGAFVLATVPFWLSGRTTRLVPAALMALSVWIVAASAFHPPTGAGLQSLLVLAVFVAALAMASAAGEELEPVLERVVPVAALVSFALIGVTLATKGLGGIGIVSPRPFALFALVVLAWYLPRLRVARARPAALLFVALSVAAIVATLSRGAFLAAVALIGLNGLLAPRANLGKRVVALVLAVGLAAAALTYVRPLHDRFTEGDVQQVHGNVSVNVEGRFEIWDAVWASFLKSPAVGHGAGSSDDLTTARFEGADHPHNDYLRLLHDYGVPGLAFWLLAFAGLVREVMRVRRKAAPFGRVAEALPSSALLALAALALTMATDNPLIYVFMLAPVGVLVGAARGLRSRRY
jgi:O-antigen ligase